MFPTYLLILHKYIIIIHVFPWLPTLFENGPSEKPLFKYWYKDME